MKKLILVAVAMLSLGACAPLGASSNPTAPVVSTQGTLADERALYAAEETYNVAATAYLAAIDAGRLPPGPGRDRLKAVLQRAEDALLAARVARRAGEANTFAEQLTLVVQLATDVRVLLAPQ